MAGFAMKNHLFFGHNKVPHGQFDEWVDRLIGILMGKSTLALQAAPKRLDSKSGRRSLKIMGFFLGDPYQLRHHEMAVLCRIHKMIPWRNACS